MGRAVSNFEYCTPFRKAAVDLKAGQFVCFNDDGEVDLPGASGANYARLLGICNKNCKAGETVPVMSFPGQRAVVRVVMGNNQNLEAGDPIKLRSDGDAELAAGGDNDYYKVAVVIGPEYRTGTASNANADEVASGTVVYTSAIYR